LIIEKIKNRRMCEMCHQDDWYCRHSKAQYGAKKIKNERTGYGTIILDFEKRAIIIQFPTNWDEMTSEEQFIWLQQHIKP
jgi:hypothetical protein